MSDFFDRIDELIERVGHGHLEGKVDVDQCYAHFQHENLELHHPRGGQGKYLEQPVIGGARQHMERIARTVLDEGGPERGMREVVDQVAREVHELAPREFDDLRNSAHASVTADGETVYDRPPLVPRLTEEELREKSRLRSAGHTSYPVDHPMHHANRRRG